MSILSALLPAILPVENRTGSGSGAPDDSSAAFAKVLETVLEKTQASAPPANPAVPSAPTGTSKPLAFPESKSGAGAFSGRAAQDDGKESPPKAAVGATVPPSGGAVDPGSLTLAALVQAAAAQAAPAPPRSSEATPGAPTSGQQGTTATAAAPLAQVPAFQRRSTAAGSAPVPDHPAQSAAPAPAAPLATAAVGLAQDPVAGSTASAVDAPVGSVMAALQAVVAAAPPAAPSPAGSVAPASPRPVSPSRSAKVVALDTATVSDTGAPAPTAPTVRALPRGTATAPSKATTSELPAPVAAASTTVWAGAADTGTAAAQVAGALAALAAGSASAPADPGATASARGVGQGTATSASTGDGAPTSSTASPSGLREMTIQLDPEHLGSVAITMRMAAGKLQIDIRVAKAQTLDVLNQDRHILSAAVEAAGASRDNVSLGAASDQAPDPERGLAGSGPQDGGSQQQTFSSRGSSDGGGTGQGPAAGTVASDKTRDDDDEPVPHAVTRSLDGSLYV